MKVLDEGHKYKLENLEKTTLPEKMRDSTIYFVKKEPISEGSNELQLVHDGTTNEEVLKMLINRMNYLQSKMSCRENAIVITKLEEALHWLYSRTLDRGQRGVEGLHIK